MDPPFLAGIYVNSSLWTTDWLHIDTSIPESDKCTAKVSRYLNTSILYDPSCELALVLSAWVSFHTPETSKTYDLLRYMRKKTRCR